MAEKDGYLNTNAHLEAKVALLMAQLAESQARELRLRDVFKWIEKNATAPEDTWYLAQATRAIAIPSDDSALREMIEAAKAEERGRVSRLVAAHIPQPSPLDSETTQGYYAALKDIAEGIAALPAVTPSIRSGCAI